MDRTPVWFMRQAGRSLPEYRALRSGRSVLEMCRDVEAAVEITLQPIRRYAVDAAILFGDIMTPLSAMGVDVEIVPGTGPVVAEPVRDADAVRRITPIDPESGVPFVLDTIRALRKELDVPLIGFAGGPFTIASYLVEGGPSKSHARTKALMYGDRETWFELMDRLSVSTLSYLRAQVDSGVQAIQIFDSWAGYVGARDYRDYVTPALERIVQGLGDLGVPRIVFGVGTGELLSAFAATGAEVVGVDWRVPLDEAARRTGGRVALQGNLDPAVCLAPWPVVEAHAAEVMRKAPARGHIFNLGHGVLPGTDPETLGRLAEYVHGWEPGA